MKEAKSINSKNHPAAATFLMRNVIESVLEEIILEQDANKEGKLLDLEAAVNLCISKHVSLPAEDKKVISHVRKAHLDYLNLGAHGTIIPNVEMVMIIRDAVDQFIRRNV